MPFVASIRLETARGWCLRSPNAQSPMHAAHVFTLSLCKPEPTYEQPK